MKKWVSEVINSLNYKRIKEIQNDERKRFMDKFSLSTIDMVDEVITDKEPYIYLKAVVNLNEYGINRILFIHNTIFKGTILNENKYFNSLSINIAKKLSEIFSGDMQIIQGSDGYIYLNVVSDTDTINIASYKVK